MPEEHVTDVERDLAAMLAVEPSPAFAAGVRARIADDGHSRGWMTWAALAAAAVIVVSAGAILTWSAREKAGELQPTKNVATAHPVVGVASDVEDPTTAQVRATTRPATRAIVSRRANEPAIIIDPALNLAVRRLLRAAQQRRTDAEVVEAAVRQADALPQDLSVAPVVVDDVVVPVIKLGEFQTGGRQ